ERARLAAEGISWSALAYHKRPTVPATLFDILAGARAAARLVREHGIDVLHARAHVPLAMALVARRFTRSRLVFDIRGLMAEEYADAGVWEEGSLKFRAVKALERAGIRKADQLVVLTRAMREWLLGEGLAGEEKIEVIPCCVDFDRYAEAEGINPDEEGTHADADAGDGGEAERFEVVYAGSVTGLYMLEEMGRFFVELRAREPRAFLRILTKSPPAEAAARLRGVGLGAEDFHVGGVAAREVPAFLRRARLGLSFRKPTFSQVAASPTKIPEYLAAGFPVVSNAHIGDTDQLLEGERVGVVVRSFTPEELARSAQAALTLAAEPGVRERCIAVARRHFDLRTVGGERYANIYRRIAETMRGAAAGVEVRRES
ncbi:MAG TPA: glycosyltransferase, partial [Pyrinomonadaceae bacterium]|nr:glycosyltransferase [Pyrinomonadaceae bacterium]